ncbi:MAG: multifunctional oxoglutarate decarboxylase/oxoglutarate dehydrogenase thiamine pyrophosphate-binding subunit/dihydrolipoyllysine-residue succinyltransferase subunit [Acidobacteria bacterium]|nr:multifunctional oxoglutarate decarboxylase/oxoglutarate dehydrogenase thiamine pyrophosphate-binding subunit/dihydrolipoyllysine-residue succinyltransferase subunit [Acidobacteriota bacterium]
MSKPSTQTDIEQLIADEFGVNADYVISLFQQFIQNPASIGQEWQGYFHDLAGNDQRPKPTTAAASQPAPSNGSVQTEPIREWGNAEAASPKTSGDASKPQTTAEATALKNSAEATAPSSTSAPQINAAPAAPTASAPAAPTASAPAQNVSPTTATLAPPTAAPATSVAAPTTTAQVAPASAAAELSERLPIRGPALRIAENMESSLQVPTATSQREIPVKLLDENRRLINHYLKASNRKVSFTHIIAHAISKALERFPQLNDAYEEEGESAYRLRRASVNLGVAVDVTKKDGSRTLLVPNIKSANRLNFVQLLDAYDDIVKRARDGKLQVADFQGTTVSLTNPGTLGTTASNPRLMAGQGVILATGSIDYPPQCQAMSPDSLSRLGISKIMTITSTYDHRIIQGAESGALLARLDEMLRGKHGFYEELFHDLGIPFRPYGWAIDINPAIIGEELQEARKQSRVLQLINAYRVRGHLLADIDPLGWKEVRYHKELDIETYGLTIWDLDRRFFADGLGGKETATLREIVEMLRQYYCGKVGSEYRNINGPEEKEWIRSRIERAYPLVPTATQEQILWKLISAELFERFLGTKYLGQKRFSIEGNETVIAVLDQLIDSAARRGVNDVTIGMSHRGRLNVIANVIGKFCERIFTIFEGSIHPKFPHDYGDVKYHQGASGIRETADGHQVALAVASNPSHLEFVDPVVEGIVRAKQDLANHEDPLTKLAVLIHGDAAFAGEGVVPETLNMSQLPGYKTAGTIHLIANNQLGFTTPPEEGRSSTYSTDIAKMIQVPIFHVNSDDPEAAYNILQLALDYRQEFRKDVVIDVIGFRKHGHNEGDEPTYTQPIMYQRIKAHPGVRQLYARKLIKEGVMSAEKIASLMDERNRRYENAQLGAKAVVAQQGKELAIPAPKPEAQTIEVVKTGIAQPVLQTIAHTITQVPREFNLNPKVVGLLTKRAKMIEAGGAVDWSMAEALAFGSLLVEGTSVRLSGQDSVRGTFSQRHAGFTDTKTGQEWAPLSLLATDNTRFHIFDSPLSEAGVLGFDYGYTLAAPDDLVLWEAQFGDFANAAQVIIDQFIASAEEKWNQKSRLVLLLPHGYEGQGPEHSSARLERYLQLCAGDNMQVVNCTTAAQYFHLLRRQVKQTPKPLVVITPKSLLRLPEVSSPVEEFTSGGFQPVLSDSSAQASQVKRVLLCSGKVYYDLAAQRKKLVNEQTAILRLEQIYPFATNLITDELQKYQAATDIRWVQEEPKNQGAWFFIAPRLREFLSADQSLRYIGRNASASTATGSHAIHQMEQHRLVEEAFAD